MKFNYIVSSNSDNIISINNKQYIYAKEDLQLFSEITCAEYIPSSINVVVMGRKTWDTLPRKNRPLKNRINIILTRNKDYKLDYKYIDTFLCFSLDQVVDKIVDISGNIKLGKTFIIGGGDIYKLAQNSDIPDDTYYIGIFNKTLTSNIDLYTTHLNDNLIYFNNPRNFNLKYIIDKGTIKSRVYSMYSNTYEIEYLNYKMEIFQNNEFVNLEEFKYLNILDNVINDGSIIDTRNGKTKSLFSERMEFDLSTGKIPLLTTKQVYWKIILKELLWFISGSTDNEVLQKQNVRIWNGNASKEFITKRGLPYEENDLGPVYGFQWRHFGAEYNDCKTDYTGQGVDQLQWVINEIKTNPTSRRLILNSWNATDIGKMVLPPCHVMIQFNICKGHLNGQMYQRSADLFLGVPFNIASYSFLLIMIAHLTGYKPGRFIHILGDCHIYVEHEDAVLIQLKRIPHEFPTVKIVPFKSREINSIDDFVLEDFKINNYIFYPKIHANMIA